VTLHTARSVVKLVSKEISKALLKGGFTLHFGPNDRIKTSSATVQNGCRINLTVCGPFYRQFQTLGPSAMKSDYHSLPKPRYIKHYLYII